MKPLLGASILAAIALSFGCGGQCRVGDPTACDPGLVCDPFGSAGQSDCFPPLEVRGEATNLSNGSGLAQVFINALDMTGIPAGQLTTSGADGAFTLRIPVVRKDEGGTPLTTQIALRAAAQGFQDYPGTLRAPPLVDTATATQARNDLPWVVQVPEPLQLESLPADRQNWPHITGTLELGGSQGAPLVVAESNGVGAARALADNLGQFILVNVPPGTYSLRIYSENAAYAQADGLQVAVGSSVDGALVGQVQASFATVSGTVQLPSGAGPTSVVLIPKSTVLPGVERGEPVPGLRAPAASIAPNVTGDFSIPAVPDGDYYVVPAYENDGLVRDPNPGAVGVDLVEVLVTGGTPSPATLPPLKVVKAVGIVSPGAGATPDVVSTTPTLTWTSYPTAASYAVAVYDASGTLAFSANGGAGATSVAVSTALAPGFYQWRITALDGAGTPISRSEDLLGVFQAH